LRESISKARMQGKLSKKIDGEVQAMRNVLSSKVKKYRQRLGLSQLGLSEKSDLSLNYITDIEGGRSGAKFATLIKLANALEVEVYELFKPDTDEEKAKVSNWGEDEINWLSGRLNEAVEKAVRETLGRKNTTT